MAMYNLLTRKIVIKFNIIRLVKIQNFLHSFVSIASTILIQAVNFSVIESAYDKQVHPMHNSSRQVNKNKRETKTMSSILGNW